MKTTRYIVESESKPQNTTDPSGKYLLIFSNKKEFPKAKSYKPKYSNGGCSKIFNALIYISVIILLILIVFFVFVKDVLQLTDILYSSASHIVALTGLFLFIFSTNLVSQKLDSKFRAGYVGNRIFIIEICLALSFFGGLLFIKCGVPNIVGNMISLIVFCLSWIIL